MIDLEPTRVSGRASRSPRRVRPLRVPTLRPRPELVDPPRGDRVVGGMLVLLVGLVGLTLATLLVVGPIVGMTAQAQLFSELRLTLAQGATPTGPLDADGHLVEPGTPIATLTAPTVGLADTVIVEGTAGAQTMAGPGHRRDTALPCQAGSSVVMARAASYGAQGEAFQKLQVGDTFGVTMAQGSCTYQVVGIRSPGDPAPARLLADGGRLTLVTAAGPAFLPTEVYRVDADLVGTAFPRPATVVPTTALPDSEQAMATDPVNGVALVFLLQLALVLGLAAVWAWSRWGRWETWIAAGPALLATGLAISTILIQLALPNLI